jgi:hypothetical protein
MTSFHILKFINKEKQSGSRNMLTCTPGRPNNDDVNGLHSVLLQAGRRIMSSRDIDPSVFRPTEGCERGWSGRGRASG